jgi:hypothetical protein
MSLDRSTVSSKPHGEEETEVPCVSGRPEGLHYTQSENVLAAITAGEQHAMEWREQPAMSERALSDGHCEICGHDRFVHDDVCGPISFRNGS